MDRQTLKDVLQAGLTIECSFKTAYKDWFTECNLFGNNNNYTNG